MTIIMTGVAEFRRALDDIVARTNAATRQAVTTGGHLLEAETKRLLSNSGGGGGTQGRDASGRFAKVARPSSPPGSPPMLQTGTLRRSIKVTTPESAGATGWTISVGPTAIYGRIQELGGDTGTAQLPARPYLKPALNNIIADGTLAACYATAWRTAF